MKLQELLSKKKSAILNRWLDEILKTYSSNTSNFLKENKDSFANPVGSTISQGIETLFEGLLGNVEFERVSSFLDNIIRIRAVQEFTPSQALAFVLLLKQVIREELRNEIMEEKIFEELLALESKIDNLALHSFDIYMKCREKIYELRAKELQNWTFRRLQRADRVNDSCKQANDVKDGSISAERKGASK